MSTFSEDNLDKKLLLVYIKLQFIFFVVISALVIAVSALKLYLGNNFSIENLINFKPLQFGIAFLAIYLFIISPIRRHLYLKNDTE